MKKVNILHSILFLYFLFSFLISAEARRIRGENPDTPPRKLYAFSRYLYDNIQKSEFTKQDVMDLTGWSYQIVHHKMILLTEAGILEVINPGRRPQYYRFKSPFDSRENLELLAGIRELDKTKYTEAERGEVVQIIKRKIETLLDAKESLNIGFSPELESHSQELKTKLLIALGYSYPGLIELFKSFSAIEIKSGNEVDLDYAHDNNKLTLAISDDEIARAISSETWDLFERYLSIRRSLPAKVIAQDMEVDVSAVYTALGMFDFSPQEYERMMSQEEQIFASILGEERASEYKPFPEELIPFEKFIAQRKSLDGLYQRFLSALRPMAKYIEEKNVILRYVLDTALTEQEREILIYRFGYFDGEPHTYWETSKKFGISIDKVKRLILSALEKMKETSVDWSIDPDLLAPHIERVNQIYQEIQELFSP